MAFPLRVMGIVLIVLFGVPSLAPAEIVRLTNGRTMQVESCVFDADMVTLVLRGGGRVRMPRTLVAELLPDEVPFARAIALEALARSTVATASWSRDDLVSLIDATAARLGVNARLAHAVIRAESNYRVDAISPRGAVGLMQIMPVILREYDVDDPFDPRKNLDAGMRHLRRLLTRFDVRRALAAYNAGETAVARYGGIPPYRETQSYVQRVLAYLR